MQNSTINQHYNSEKDYISIVKNFGPGNLPEKETIDNFDQIDLFFMIESLETFMLSYTVNKLENSSEKWCQDIELNEIKNLTKIYYYCITQTKKFGVKLPISHLFFSEFKLTDSYNNWFRFYLKYFDGLQKDETLWNEFLSARKTGKDVSEFLPKENWKFELTAEDRSYFQR